MRKVELRTEVKMGTGTDGLNDLDSGLATARNKIDVGVGWYWKTTAIYEWSSMIA